MENWYESFKRPETENREEKSVNMLAVMKSFDSAEAKFKRTVEDQGFIGRGVDWMKNNLGTSAQSDSMLGRAWSNVLNSDNGSAATAAKFDADRAEMAQLAKYGYDSDNQAHRFGQADSMIKAANVRADGYKASQNSAIDLVADAATLTGVLASRKVSTGLVESLVAGAVLKTGIKFADGTDSNLTTDAMSGATLGVSLPLGRAVGLTADAAVSYSLGRSVINPVLSYGLEGATIGYAQETSSRFVANRESGMGVQDAYRKSISNPLESPSVFAGALLGGFAGKVAYDIASMGAYRGAVGSTSRSFELNAVSSVDRPDLLRDIRETRSSGLVPGKAPEKPFDPRPLKRDPDGGVGDKPMSPSGNKNPMRPIGDLSHLGAQAAAGAL